MPWNCQPVYGKLVLGKRGLGVDVRPLPNRGAVARQLVCKNVGGKKLPPGRFMVRQLEFSLFDFRIHLEYEPGRGGNL